MPALIHSRRGILHCRQSDAKDVATVLVKSLNEKQTIKKTYHLGGETDYWKDIKIIDRAYDKNKWTVPTPNFAIKGNEGFFI